MSEQQRCWRCGLPFAGFENPMLVSRTGFVTEDVVDVACHDDCKPALKRRIAELEAQVVALKQPLPDTIAPALESGDVWFCKVGYAGSIPKNADWPMRQAVQHAFALLTGHEAKFVFSGWGHKLSDGELAVVENRDIRTAPKPKEADQ